MIRVKVEIKMTETAKEPYAVIFTNEMTEAVRQAAAILEGAVSNKAITVTDNERIFVLRPEELYMLRVENERAAVYTRTKRFDSGRRLYEFEDIPSRPSSPSKNPQSLRWLWAEDYAQRTPANKLLTTSVFAVCIHTANRKTGRGFRRSRIPPRRAHDTLQPQDESIIVGYYTSAEVPPRKLPRPAQSEIRR